MTYTNLVMPYYMAKFERSYYTNPKIEYVPRTRKLIKEALDHWKQQGTTIIRKKSRSQIYDLIASRPRRSISEMLVLKRGTLSY